MGAWILRRQGYCEKTHLHDAPVYSLGNGVMGCRGFFEEQTQGVAALGGIYMAGVFGAAEGRRRELVNVPNFFSVRLAVNGLPLTPGEICMDEFETELDLLGGTLRRSYTYVQDGKALVRVVFFRFLSMDDPFTAGQRVEITPLGDGLTVDAECRIDTDVTNLNLESIEPEPIQPGRRFFTNVERTADSADVCVAGPDRLRLAFAQKTACGVCAGTECETGCNYRICVEKGVTAIIERQIAAAVTTWEEDALHAARGRLAALPAFDEHLARHRQAMRRRWDDADIQVEGDEESQLALRYNIYQLMTACPTQDDRYSIGARGLTGEMYEGCVFWDTELFMLPFFTLTDPRAARGLLAFRYHTLGEARRNARQNFFSGAMYGWQVNYLGEEQTPPGVGAFYAIHNIADIAFAILQYWLCTRDTEYMLSEGLEILLETARFWASRVDRRADGRYDLLAVRGPNEYDVIVNNNLFTNMMARENLILCRSLIEQFRQMFPGALQAVTEKIGFAQDEQAHWREIEDGLILPYDGAMDLWLEDETYLRRRPLDIKTSKKDGKRIIDSTLPYEALALYQVTKQSDVLLLMQLLPAYFTRRQQEIAYEYYMPRTAFDSSLGHFTAAIMAARLERMAEAMEHFRRMAHLDLNNVQLNTINGLHYANLGGTWQAAVFGFGGVSVSEEGISVDPCLPDAWRSLRFCLYHRGAQVEFTLEHTQVHAVYRSGTQPVRLRLCGVPVRLSPAIPETVVPRDGHSPA